MEKNNELFTTMPVGRAVAKLVVPTVVSQIIVILYSLADTFFYRSDRRSQSVGRAFDHLSDLHAFNGDCKSLWYWCQQCDCQKFGAE